MHPLRKHIRLITYLIYNKYSAYIPLKERYTSLVLYEI